MTKQPLKIGDVAKPDDVIAIHSTDLCEDGKSFMRLYDLRDSRTGAQLYTLGEPSSQAIYVCG